MCPLTAACFEAIAVAHPLRHLCIQFVMIVGALKIVEDIMIPIFDHEGALPLNALTRYSMSSLFAVFSLYTARKTAEQRAS